MVLKEDIFNRLNPEQKQAVTFGEGPVLIVAGAGTGKTTVITQRIAWLIEKVKAKPEEILALTFTDKAAGEMEERVDALLPIGYVDLWVSTFHSFCERLLKNHGLDIGLPIDFKLLDSTAAWVLLRQNLNKFNLDYYRPLGNPTRFIHALLTHFSRCKDQAIWPQDYLQYSQDLKSQLTDLPESVETERIKEVANSYHLYQKLLLENSALDFGDLINYCLRLFQKRPTILERYQQQFKYILVDEFQDTNWAQYELVKMLAKPRNNLAVAADDDQSVYKWRGASYNNVLQFRKDYPDCKEISLIRNYRSGQDILDLSYRFIQANNPNRLEVLDKINKKLIACRQTKGTIEHLHFKTLEQEVAGVANKIIELLNQDKEACLSDFAILVRANHSAGPFARALDRAEIPYYFFASRGLYSKPVILDIISYLKILDNYHESSAVYRVLNLPFLAILGDDIMQLTQYAKRRTVSLYEALCQASLISGLSQKTRVKINFLLSLIKKHSADAKQKNVSEVFVDFLERSGYLKYLTQKEKTIEINLVSQFHDKLKAFEGAGLEPRLANFMEQLNMELESGEQGKLAFDVSAGPDMVRLLTIHGAKGLEFPYVFLVNLVAQRFPTNERKEPIELPQDLIKEIMPEGDVHLQEERRLCYVAMTRAKKGLFLTSAKDYGGVRTKKLSRFLAELGFGGESPEPDFTEVGPRQICRGPTSVKFTVKSAAGSAEIIPPHFSFSQLAAFSNCPLQYKFAHILKVPVRGRAVFSFGKTMHNTLYEFVKLSIEAGELQQKGLFESYTPQRCVSLHTSGVCQAIKFEELLEVYQKNWIDDWYESKEQKDDYYKLGKKIIKKFYQEFSKSHRQILYINGLPALEQWFNLKIQDSTLKGRIDRIDKLDEEVEIIDYKTGKHKEKLSSQDKEQLLIYQIAAEEALNLRPAKLTYYYLQDAKKLSFLGTDKDKQKQKKKILSQIEQIKSSDFSPTPGWQCKTCDSRDFCNHRWQSE